MNIQNHFFNNQVLKFEYEEVANPYKFSIVDILSSFSLAFLIVILYVLIFNFVQLTFLNNSNQELKLQKNLIDQSV